MGPYTAGEVNKSIVDAINQFHRDALYYGGPGFQAKVGRIVRGAAMGFGDAGDDGSDVVDVTPDSTGLFDLAPPVGQENVSVPSDLSNITGGLSLLNVVAPSNVAASAATVPDSLTTTLNQLVSGIQAGSNALIQGTASYFNALTQVNNIQKAAAAGVPVSVYNATQAGTNTISSLFANGKVLGVPLWVIAGGLAVFLISGERRPATRRR